MGNRAVISFGKPDDISKRTVGIYLHWNGGRESVQAFLDAAKELGVRTNDVKYGSARLAQIIGNFFGGETSVGVGVASRMDCDNGDNGVFVIDDKFDIVERLHAPSGCDQFFGTTKGQEYYKAVKEEALRVNTPFFKRELGQRTVVVNEKEQKS